MNTAVILGGLVIFLFRTLSITMSTVRTILIMRGMKLISAVVGFFEVLIFILVIGQVVQDISNYWNVMGYCLGFSAGTWIGMIIEERMAMGFVAMRLVSVKASQEIAQALREAGCGVTELVAMGKDGPVWMLEAVVSRKDLQEVLNIAMKIDNEAFVTAEDIRSVRKGFISRISTPAR